VTRVANRPPDALVTIVADTWTAPYWDAAREGRLTCAQCSHCHRFRMPPSPFCPHCRHQGIDWPTLPGSGTVFSYTIVERAVLPGTEDTIPYVPAVVSLDGAAPCRVITNIVDSDIAAIRIGATVRVVFDRLDGGAAIPRFVIEDKP
jgi:uncharacterized OB-fold protein